MVSLRKYRTKLLNSGRTPTSIEVTQTSDDVAAAESINNNIKLASVYPISLYDFIQKKQGKEEPLKKEKVDLEASIAEENPDVSEPSSSKEESVQQYSVPEFKRRKRHRRKQVGEGEDSTMRGVYFKNMKWQAAIKVDKKQIHLGTVESQEEAARLYDRAAFLCGREPNFELSEKEKQELLGLSWEGFLARTRSSFVNRKNKRRRLGAAIQVNPEPVLHRDREDHDCADGETLDL